MQRVDAQPAVVGEGGQATEVGGLARLEVGIVRKGIADLVGLRKPEFFGADAGDS